MTTSTLPDQVRRALLQGEDHLQAALDRIAEAFGALTATLHRTVAGAPVLRLAASRGLPEKVLAITGEIPFGKGMAGICAARREPVTVCNLQTDASGTVRPGARETGVAGAVVVPVLDPGGSLVGTLGIGKAGEHEYSPEEIRILEECARLLAGALTASRGG